MHEQHRDGKERVNGGVPRGEERFRREDKKEIFSYILEWGLIVRRQKSYTFWFQGRVSKN